MKQVLVSVAFISTGATGLSAAAGDWYGGGMQSSDGAMRFERIERSAQERRVDRAAVSGDAGSTGSPDGPEAIRERQRRRRDAGRLRNDIEAILARPDDEDEDDDETDEDEATPPGPAPARVFVVFRGARWDDPDGALRESDTIDGVYATEEAARRAVAAMNKETGEREDAWYQPYPVQT